MLIVDSPKEKIQSSFHQWILLMVLMLFFKNFQSMLENFLSSLILFDFKELLSIGIQCEHVVRVNTEYLIEGLKCLFLRLIIIELMFSLSEKSLNLFILRGPIS